MPAGKYSPTDEPNNVALTDKASIDGDVPRKVIDVDSLRLELKKATV